MSSCARGRRMVERKCAQGARMRSAVGSWTSSRLPQLMHRGGRRVVVEEVFFFGHDSKPRAGISRAMLNAEIAG